MIYKVRARYIETEVKRFFEKLTDGTIAGQEPDGEEIVTAMQTAKITEPGIIEWYETCYCRTPLEHERATVYDSFLSGISTERVSASGEIAGDAFWSYMEAASGQ
ncbi:MAG: hypothetical protein ACE5GZ_00820 [Gammaproteobacteria bacterium]